MPWGTRAPPLDLLEPSQWISEGRFNNLTRDVVGLGGLSFETPPLGAPPPPGGQPPPGGTPAATGPAPPVALPGLVTPEYAARLRAAGRKPPTKNRLKSLMRQSRWVRSTWAQGAPWLCLTARATGRCTANYPARLDHNGAVHGAEDRANTLTWLDGNMACFAVGDF